MTMTMLTTIYPIGYAAGRRPIVPGDTFFVITKLQKRRTDTAVTATGSRATTCEVGNVLLALVPDTIRVSSTSISRRGMPHALTALRRRGLVAKSNRFPAARSSGASVAANTTSYMCG